MDSDNFIEDIESYLIIRRDEYSPSQIKICQELKEAIFSDTPYGIGERPLFDLEKVSLQDTLKSLNTADLDHFIYYDLVYFYRTGIIEECTDNKEYIICGLFDMFVLLMRGRLQDVLGVPEIIYTMYGKRDRFVTEEWQDVMNIALDYQETIVQVNDSSIAVNDDRVQDLVIRSLEDPIFQTVQALEYHAGRSNVVHVDPIVMVRNTVYFRSSVFNSGFEGYLPLLPWLVFNSMGYVELKYFRSICKGAYGMYNNKRSDEEFPVLRYDNIPPPRSYSGGMLQCSLHRKMFCVHPDHQISYSGDIVNSVFSWSDFSILEQIYRSLTRLQRSVLYSMSIGRSEYQCVPIILSFLLTMVSRVWYNEVVSMICRYKRHFRFGIVLMRFMTPSLYLTRMIDNRNLRLNFVSPCVRENLVVVPSRVCNGYPIAAIQARLNYRPELCRVTYPVLGLCRLWPEKRRRRNRRGRRKKE